MTEINLGKYPYDELEGIKKNILDKFPSVIDLSVGTPVDPVPQVVVDSVINSPFAYSGYPQSAGGPDLLKAISLWLEKKFGVSLGEESIGACVGTKEFVASLGSYLKNLWPGKQYILYPTPSYPTYRVSAILAGLTPIEVALVNNRLMLDDLSQEVIGSSLCLFVNSPANPSGEICDLKETISWAKQRNIPVVSDECYIDFAWDNNACSALQLDSDNLIALFSLSKRSNMAGFRVGFYAGDPNIVGHLKNVRKHAGLMIPGPSQKAGVTALYDETHVEKQRCIYKARLESMVRFLNKIGLDCAMPEATFYIWLNVREFCETNLGVNKRVDWAFTQYFAESFGALVSPGSFYETESDHVRIALVAKDNQLAELFNRA